MLSLKYPVTANIITEGSPSLSPRRCVLPPTSLPVCKPWPHLGRSSSRKRHRLVEPYVRSKSLGPMAIKGQQEPVAVYEVTGRKPWRSRLEISAQRGLTPLAGNGNWRCYTTEANPQQQ